MNSYSVSVACKQCGGTAVLKVSGVTPNNSGSGTATCYKCYKISPYAYTLTEGAFSYLR